MTEDRQIEENPFETPQVAAEWITSVENEKGLIRDNELYPFLKKWVSDVHPKALVEIGAGQGICSDKIDSNDFGAYLGIEPSTYLVERAVSLYGKLNRQFVVGNAYQLPIENGEIDGAFSVNVWFHLSNLEVASSELSRILKTGGRFLIITVNPKAYGTWESFYFDYKKEGNKIVGKVRVPINPLSSNTFFAHTLDEIKQGLESNSLRVSKMEEFGTLEGVREKLFIAIAGEKF